MTSAKRQRIIDALLARRAQTTAKLAICCVVVGDGDAKNDYGHDHERTIVIGKSRHDIRKTTTHH